MAQRELDKKTNPMKTGQKPNPMKLKHPIIQTFVPRADILMQTRREKVHGYVGSRMFPEDIQGFTAANSSEKEPSLGMAWREI